MLTRWFISAVCFQLHCTYARNTDHMKNCIFLAFHETYCPAANSFTIQTMAGCPKSPQLPKSPLGFMAPTALASHRVSSNDYLSAFCRSYRWVYLTHVQSSHSARMQLIVIPRTDERFSLT